MKRPAPGSITLAYASPGDMALPAAGRWYRDTVRDERPLSAAGTLSGVDGYRAYSDGVYTTVSRQSVSEPAPGPVDVVSLPYRSVDVIRRMGPYDVLGELGRGGMGVVYRAFSLRLCRPCAIKVMNAGEPADPVQLIRFQNEAMLAARLRHPNIVQVFDAGELDGEFYFVMELVEGRPLDAFAADPTCSTQELVRVVAKSARALAYAHAHGIVHRDVKPDNILVSADGEPHITDFGIAANVTTERRITNDGALMGTPAYMSPEQVNGELTGIGPATDQYSLGASLYHMVTGTPPFSAPTTIELLIKVLNEDPPSAIEASGMGSQRPVDLDLATVIAKALEKKTAERYPSIAAFAEDLEAYVEDRPITARPISRGERFRKLVRRNRAAFAMTSVVFATLLVVGASFGAVTVFNIERTSEVIREQDRLAGLEQAATLERAIRANMLQGRADVVRDLVRELRKDPNATSVDVVRVDRSFAYTDHGTARDVNRRLQTLGYIDEVLSRRPEFASKLQDVQARALPSIAATHDPTPRLFAYDRLAWNGFIEKAQPLTSREVVDGQPVLTVMKPILNDEQCAVCHGADDEAGYSSNHVRAVLVVRRSQQAIEERIAANKATARMVGLGTAGVILALVFAFARTLGLRFRRRRFSA